MGSEQRVVCPENEALVEYMRKWWNQMAETKPKNYTPNTENNINKAFTNVCKHKTPITTLKEFKAVKGIGKWFVTQMREFFNSISEASQDDVSAKGDIGKKAKGSRSYLPQKNSAAYALLISLHRGTANGTEFMRKQDLIAAAEASGLSRVPIRPETGKGKPQPLGNSPREWYSGWNAMKTLVDKGLVFRTSCPAKYMLSEAGRRVALECLSRSGMCDSTQNAVETLDSIEPPVESFESLRADSPTYSHMSSKDKKIDIPPEFLERFTALGYTREQVCHALAELPECSSSKDITTLWPTILCRLRENDVYDVDSDSQTTLTRNSEVASTSYNDIEGQQKLTSAGSQSGLSFFRSTASPVIHAANVIPSSLDDRLNNLGQSGCIGHHEILRLPPLDDVLNFEDAYKVVLILDDREHVTRKNNTKLIEKICDEFKIEIEVRRLPVGDGIWIARHKEYHTEYVLDFIVERKNVDDLRCSIRDNRYRDQKLRLQRTGIKKIMYLVEGDPNACDGADCIKTACFTTEILEGFDVQRTNGLGDTFRRYGYLTMAIAEYYKLNTCSGERKPVGKCPTYAQFVRKCEDVDKMTVSDLFATQLMQVPQVTEEVAIAVVNCYPTLYSLAHAYADLDEDIAAQEALLTKKCEGAVSLVASKNIFRFVWA